MNAKKAPKSGDSYRMIELCVELLDALYPGIALHIFICKAKEGYQIAVYDGEALHVGPFQAATVVQATYKLFCSLKSKALPVVEVLRKYGQV